MADLKLCAAAVNRSDCGYQAAHLLMFKCVNNAWFNCMLSMRIVARRISGGKIKKKHGLSPYIHSSFLSIFLFLKDILSWLTPPPSFISLLSNNVIIIAAKLCCIPVMKMHYICILCL